MTVVTLQVPRTRIFCILPVGFMSKIGVLIRGLLRCCSARTAAALPLTPLWLYRDGRRNLLINAEQRDNCDEDGRVASSGLVIRKAHSASP